MINGDAMAEQWTDSVIVAFRAKLLDWFAKHRRDLPWRRTRDPYAIWVSEIMLQQTQVATVIPYFERFLARFPDVETLAGADQQSVLELWAGLGYYRRARQLHAAAQRIVTQHGGTFPCAIEAIHALPGIGRYTAGAVASQAFDVPAPIVEANTQRVYARLLALAGDLRKTAHQKQLWGFAERLHAPTWNSSAGTGKPHSAPPTTLPNRSRGPATRSVPSAGAFNQALMELGSLVCTPAAPDCRACPVSEHCRAYAMDVVDAIPLATKRPVVTQQVHVGVLVRRGRKWLMRQNSEDQWWSGLWDFPRVDGSVIERQLAANARSGGLVSQVAEHVAARVHRDHGLPCEPLQMVGHFSHSVTRYRIRLYCLTAQAEGVQLRRLAGKWRWIDLADGAVPLTSAARRVCETFLEIPIRRSP